MIKNKKISFQIIHLNGPSNSGKTTLAKALQGALDPPFLHVGIDKIIGMMPEKTNKWVGGIAELGFSWKSSQDKDGNLIQELEMGSFAKEISESYRQIVVLLARMGHCLIIDDVAFGKNEMERWRKLLHEFQVLYVGVTSSLQVLEFREKQRGNRMVGSARAQYFTVHVGNQYDLELDTTLLDTKACVDLVLTKMKSQTSV